MSSKKPPSLPDGFEHTTLRIPISEIMPMREVPATVRKSAKYKQIAASIAEVGIIEPPVVFRDRVNRAQYNLLEGHVRLAILLERGETTRLPALPTTVARGGAPGSAPASTLVRRRPSRQARRHRSSPDRRR